MKFALAESVLHTVLCDFAGQERPNAPKRGMEKRLQTCIAKHLDLVEEEVSLDTIRAQQTDGSTKGRLDILHRGTHGIELKVLSFPRLAAVGSTSLYDIGQISSDYWRLSTARKLKSAELLLLLHGPLVSTLSTPASVRRELHNRLFVDFETSRLWFELFEQRDELRRKRQIKAVRAMGLHQPYKSSEWLVVTHNSFALVSIPVLRR